MKTCTAKHYKTQYKSVTEVHQHGKIRYKASMAAGVGKLYDDIRSAALAVDKYLIKKGKNPVNILVKK
ncbi:hypothetical protein [Chryseobacterium sp. 2VB]|uniref:hypothetical protein n=1 Tax=Chryseobacterium sp. 2VB TaxID=2502204 RepID=UPI0010F6D410|nr:hypothetical protein [Chryseobacterium sp. 2VB]